MFFELYWSVQTNESKTEPSVKYTRVQSKEIAIALWQLEGG